MLTRIHIQELFNSRCAVAAVFDMDGVLADTAAYHLEAWAALARAHALYPAARAPGTPGGHSANELIHRTFGQTNDRIIPLLWRHAGKPLEADLGKLSYEKEAYYRDAARGRVQPLPGLERLLGWLHRSGVPTAIGTSAPPENVRLLLREFGWEELFCCLVDRTRFAAGKPAPACFLKAASEMRVQPRRTIVFEDSIHGLLGARQGGFIPAGVATLHTASELRFHSRWVFTDFREVSC